MRNNKSGQTLLLHFRMFETPPAPPPAHTHTHTHWSWGETAAPDRWRITSARPGAWGRSSWSRGTGAARTAPRTVSLLLKLLYYRAEQPETGAWARARHVRTCARADQRDSRAHNSPETPRTRATLTGLSFSNSYGDSVLQYYIIVCDAIPDI